MNVDIIFKIAAIGILITVICQILKKSDRDDIATLVSLAGLIIVLTLVISMISQLFDSVKEIFNLYAVWKFIRS
ncbi:MAG: stage III sporulation protein AC [Clostridia bacterium]|nr:stage III sporulation protein AC [Clostridia bacterium]